MIQLDGDRRRNEFINSPWARVCVPMRAGREREAIEEASESADARGLDHLSSRLGSELKQMYAEIGRQIASTTRPVRVSLARRSQTPVRAGHLIHRAQQLGIGAAKQRDVGDRQRAQRFAVIGIAQGKKARLPAAPVIAPVMKTHLQRDLYSGCAIGRIEAMPEMMAGQRRQPLGELHHRFVREAGEHDVLEGLQLLAQCGVDAGVGMAEQVGPPRADAIKQRISLLVIKPASLSFGNGNQGQRFVMLHLCARVPNGSQTAIHKSSLI